MNSDSPFPTWPHYELEQIEAVSTILNSGKVNYWTGIHGKAFEKEFSEWCGCSNSVAIANGTLALTSCYRSLNLSPNDEVITTPRTFIATSSSLSLLGIKPVFADVDKNSGCINAETIAKKITAKTKAISVVHIGGWPADMEAICKLAKEYNLSVIEDCAQAHGASINVNGQWKPVGSFGDIAAWSFCQDKIMTTGGEGGMVSTSREDLRDFIWSFKDHGKNTSSYNPTKNTNSYRWLHDDFGSNYRLTEIQSCIGRIQLTKMSEWNSIRSRNAKVISNYISDIPSIRVPLPPKNYQHAWYKFYAYLRPDYLKDGWSRDRIISEIVKYGYPAYSGCCSEIYLEKCFIRNACQPKKRLPIARELGETSLMFLIHPTITKQIIDKYAQVISIVLKKATK